MHVELLSPMLRPGYCASRVCGAAAAAFAATLSNLVRSGVLHFLAALVLIWRLAKVLHKDQHAQVA